MTNLEERIERIEKALETLGVKLPPLKISPHPNELAEIRRLLEDIRIENEKNKRAIRAEEAKRQGSYYWESYTK